ncbi:MAG: DnaA regulatory inactivator Hda [Burkholderiaceae bacterium]|nr:DnaA regulatory inactivator Hda [Burkholderiaceae bacterium]
MRQLLLNLRQDIAPSLDSFVVGKNQELWQLVKKIAANDSKREAHFVYLWGESGSGKSHLLRALAQSPNARYIRPDAPSALFNFSDDIHTYLLDDCEQLSDHAQIDAFALFNEVRAHGANILCAGRFAPRALALREDLRTRLGWGLIYEVHELTDDDKMHALETMADLKSMPLSPSVLSYIITHFRRDMPSLSQLITQLDEYSLETKRPITLALLRDLLRDLLHDLEPQIAVETETALHTIDTH